MYATVAMLSATLSGFGIAAPPAPSPPREKVPARDPNGPAPWLAPTLPPLDPPKRERVREVKRRSKAERLQRRKKRKQRQMG
jgi:hypothetical protein